MIIFMLSNTNALYQIQVHLFSNGLFQHFIFVALCIIVKLQVLIVKVDRPMLWCLSMRPTRVATAAFFCELALSYKICI